MASFDYERAMAQARELRAIASEMLLSRTLMNAINGAETSWQGAAADHFQIKCGELTETIRSEANKILIIAGDLEKAATAADQAASFT